MKKKTRVDVTYYLIYTLLIGLLAWGLWYFQNWLLVGEFEKSVEEFAGTLPLGDFLLHQVPWYFLFAVFVVWFIGQFDAVKDGLRGLAERVVFRFYPAEPEFLSLPGKKGDALNFTARKARLIGQEARLGELNSFAEGEEKFRWWFLIGEGGTGKSRIALEWILGLPRSRWFSLKGDGYHVGFRDGRYPGEKWEPARRTVMVIDDAGEKPEELLAFIERAGWMSKRWKYPLRVLLLERSVPKSLDDLNEKGCYKEFRYRGDALKTVRLSGEQIEALSKEFAKDAANVGAEGIQEKIEKISQGNPLIAQLVVSMLEEDGEIEWESRDEFLKGWVEKMVAKWKQLGYGESCLPVLMLATLARGVTREAALEVGDVQCVRKDVLDRILNTDTAEMIPGITPDIVGEAFLLEMVRRLDTGERKRLLQTAWQVKKRGVLYSLFLMNFDFPDHTGLCLLDERPKDVQDAILWSKMKVFLLGRKNCRISDVISHLMQLKEARAEFDDNVQVNIAYMDGTINAIKAYIPREKELEINQAWESLRLVGRKYPENVDIQIRLARGAVSIIKFYCKEHRWADVQMVKEVLNKVSEKFPENLDIHNEFFNGKLAIISTISGDIRATRLRRSRDYNPEMDDFDEKAS